MTPKEASNRDVARAYLLAVIAHHTERDIDDLERLLGEAESRGEAKGRAEERRYFGIPPDVTERDPRCTCDDGIATTMIRQPDEHAGRCLAHPFFWIYKLATTDEREAVVRWLQSFDTETPHRLGTSIQSGAHRAEKEEPSRV